MSTEEMLDILDQAAALIGRGAMGAAIAAIRSTNVCVGAGDDHVAERLTEGARSRWLHSPLK
jgi:hypothetical protein